MATILFVDDDLETLELMEKAVTVLGHTTLTSSAPNTAIALACLHSPDFILVDQHLDIMDGCALIERIHLTPGLDATPVYLISAYLSEEDTACARQAGAVGCLEKPITLAHLSQLLGKAVGK